MREALHYMQTAKFKSKAFTVKSLPTNLIIKGTALMFLEYTCAGIISIFNISYFI